MGTETAVHRIQVEFERIITSEQERIAKDLESRPWTYRGIPFKMKLRSAYLVLRKPKYFFYMYFKSLQAVLANRIRNGLYR